MQTNTNSILQGKENESLLDIPKVCIGELRRDPNSAPQNSGSKKQLRTGDEKEGVHPHPTTPEGPLPATPLFATAKPRGGGALQPPGRCSSWTSRRVLPPNKCQAPSTSRDKNSYEPGSKLLVYSLVAV